MLDNINLQKPLSEIKSGEVWFSKKTILHYIIILLLILVIIAGWFNYKPHDTSVLEKKIEQSQVKIDSLSKSNTKLKYKITNFEDHIDLINSKIISNQKDISNLKKKTNEKVNAVDNYSNDQLLLFLTNRYNQNISSKTNN